MDDVKLTEALAEELRKDYRAVRILPDGSIAAIGDLLFTRALFLGCTQWGYERRFCFENRPLADQRFTELQSDGDEPQGYTARR